MAKRDEQRRINTRPEGSAQAAGTLITPTQVIGGLPNTIGGWVFGPASLGNSGIVLHSGGWIQVGIDDYTVRLDALDTAYRMWAGAPLGVDAPFSITVDGSLHAENAYIEGEIVAETGAIGGFVIGADHIRDVADSMGLASVVTAGDDVRFWAGDTFANRAIAPFRVTEAGLLTAQGATIEGALTATTGELVNLDVSGLLNLVVGGIIKSDNFATGVSGWRVDHNGDAEFNNIHARGRIDTAVFQYDQISAISGSILVTPTAGALGATYTTAGTLTIEGATWAFATGDVVRIRALDSLGAVKQVWVTVTRTGATNVYTTVKNSGDDATWPIGTAVLGYGTGGGSLMMTAASALDGPRYSVLTHGINPWTDEVEVGRFGLLDNWQTYPGTDYGIAIGDYAGGNYLLYGTTAQFQLKAGSGSVSLSATGIDIEAPAAGAYAQVIGPETLVWGKDVTEPYPTRRYPLAMHARINGYPPAAGSLDTLLMANSEGLNSSGNIPSVLTIRNIGKAGSTYTDQRMLFDSETGIIMRIATLGSETVSLTLNNDGDLLIPGTIRESVPIHMRLTQRTTTQSIPSGAWTYRYLNTVEYANTGSGIAGDDLVWMHMPLVFTGTGLNDLTRLGQATYPDSTTTQFQVKITAVGTPDSFQYSMDNGATWNGTDIAITGASQSIGGAKDVRIQFTATTGHTLNDLWDWDELPRHMIVANKAGLYQIVAAASFGVTAGTTLPYRIQTAIRKNGTLYQTDQVVVQAQAEQAIDIMVSALVWLNVGDWVDCPIYQNSGVSKDTVIVTDSLQHANGVTIARVA